MIFLQTGVRLRAADDEAAGGVDENAGVLVEQLRRNGRADDLIDQLLTQAADVHVRRVLRGDDDRVHAHGLVLLVIFHGDLRLAVGAEIVDDLMLAHLGEALCQLVRQRDRQRHELRGLAAGEAEHHALVARAVVEILALGLLRLEGLVHAHGDVAALLVDARHDGAGVAVEAELRAVIADLAHGLAHDVRNVDVAAGGDLAHHGHDAGRGGDLAGHAAVRILREDRVEHGVGDLVADFVGMSLGYGFGGKQMMCHNISFLSEIIFGFRAGKERPARRSALKLRVSLIFRFAPPDLAPRGLPQVAGLHRAGPSATLDKAYWIVSHIIAKKRALSSPFRRLSKFPRRPARRRRADPPRSRA